MNIAVSFTTNVLILPRIKSYVMSSGLPSSGLSTVGLVRCSNQRVNGTAEGLGPVTIRN